MNVDLPHYEAIFTAPFEWWLPGWTNKWFRKHKKDEEAGEADEESE